MLSKELIETSYADVVTRISDAVAAVTLTQLGGGLIIFGLLLAVTSRVERWIRQRGYRMVLKDRNDKIHALLLDILVDGIEDAELVGRISRQEANKLYADLQKKLGLNDLVPKPRLASMVKAKLKSARHLREEARRNGQEYHPNIPGEKPPPIIRRRDVA